MTSSGGQVKELEAAAALGTLQVLNGAMTVGALIAAMALVWRVLSPLQVGFLSLTRLEQVKLGLKQKIILARAYVTQASIYLFDEPAYHLDAASDTALMRKLQQLRGQATVFIVTQRPSHMRLADRLIVLDSGTVALAGHPEAVLAKMQKAAAA